MAPSIGLIFGSRQRMACRFTPNGSGPLRRMLVLWAQLVSMSESRQVGSWRGAYLHPPQVRNAELLPALMWVRVARLAWVLGLVPTSVRRNGTFDRLATAFCRGVGWCQSVSWSFKSHAFLGTMRIERKASLQPPSRDHAAI
jgi:hypothetical protein